jgi:hypothetical protein
MKEGGDPKVMRVIYLLWQSKRPQSYIKVSLGITGTQSKVWQELTHKLNLEKVFKSTGIICTLSFT